MASEADDFGSSFSLTSVVRNPRAGTERSSVFGSLFEDPRDKEPTISVDRSLSIHDFAECTSPALTKLYASFVLHHAENEAETSKDVQDPLESEPFRAVPKQFFDADFKLADASPALLSDQTDRDAAWQQAHQDELAHHLDVVEGVLVKQLSSSSGDFFRALSNFQDLWMKVAAACQQVQQLRMRIREMQCDTVEGTMRVPRLACRQSNLVRLHSKLQHVAYVRTACDAVRELMLAEDFSAAVDVVAACRLVLKEHLEGLSCVQHLAQHLTQFEGLAMGYMGAQWVQLALTSSWQPVEGGEDAAAKNGKHDDTPTTDDFSNRSATLQHETPKLVNVMRGLMRSGKMASVLDKYQSRFEDEAREILGTVVHECVADAEDAKGASTTVTQARLVALDCGAFQSCLDLCLEHVLSHVCTAVALHNLLIDFVRDGRASSKTATNKMQQLRVVSASADKSEALASHVSNAGDLTVEQLEVCQRSSQVTQALCESALQQISRLLTQRKEAQSRLKLHELKQLWDSSLNFVKAIEYVSCTTGYGLRSALLAHAKAFVEHKHARHKNELATTLDSEKWAQADFCLERQKALEALAPPPPGTKPEIVKVAAGKRELHAGVVDGKAYKVVWSAVVLLEMILENLAVASNFHVLATDVLQRVVDVLRFFEQRTKQLVLCAGAIHSSARLRTITAKHLALASNCLSFFAALLPHVRAHLAAQLPPKHQPLLIELDAVAKDYGEHRTKILSKFVSIIAESVDASALALPGTDWDAAAPTDAPRSSFIGDVVKNVAAMHSVLLKQLPREQLVEVHTNIRDLLNSKIPQLFEACKPATANGKLRVAEDLRFLSAGFAKVDALQPARLKLDALIDAYSRR